MHSSHVPHHGRTGAIPPKTWDQILAQLAEEVPQLVDEFIVRFREQEPYPDDQVSGEDIAATAHQTFTILVRRLRGEPDPPGVAGTIERLAARRAQQGVPMAQFLRAVRTDFRVLWKRADEIAGPEGAQVLAENVMRLFDTVDEYVDALREAYRAEESRIDRTHVALRARTILRLFSGQPLAAGELEVIAGRLGMRSGATYELLTVTGEGIPAMLAKHGSDSSVGVFETVSDLTLFREQQHADQWLREAQVVGGYIGNIGGIGSIATAAGVARTIAAHAADSPKRLSTEENVWPALALKHVTAQFPDFSRSVSGALQEITEHERVRLVEAARTYLETGSVKATAERLFCHRNTVINRLKQFAEVTGFDPTVPREAAWVLVALSAQGPERT